MKTSFSIQTNFCCGWYPGDPFKLLEICLFDKIGDEIFFSLQIIKFTVSISFSLY